MESCAWPDGVSPWLPLVVAARPIFERWLGAPGNGVSRSLPLLTLYLAYCGGDRDQSWNATSWRGSNVARGTPTSALHACACFTSVGPRRASCHKLTSLPPGAGGGGGGGHPGPPAAAAAEANTLECRPALLRAAQSAQQVTLILSRASSGSTSIQPTDCWPQQVCNIPSAFWNQHNWKKHCERRIDPRCAVLAARFQVRQKPKCTGAGTARLTSSPRLLRPGPPCRPAGLFSTNCPRSHPPAFGKLPLQLGPAAKGHCAERRVDDVDSSSPGCHVAVPYVKLALPGHDLTSLPARLALEAFPPCCPECGMTNCIRNGADLGPPTPVGPLQPAGSVPHKGPPMVAMGGRHTRVARPPCITA